MNASLKGQPRYLGIEIGGTKTQVVLGAPGGVIVDRRRFSVNAALGAQGIREDIASAIESFRRDGAITASGIAFGGPIRRSLGKTLTSHQIAGWDDYPILEWARELTASPVALENDANAAALAESIYGAGKERPSMFYITLGSGVGGGLVRAKRLYHGHLSSETEIGHLTIHPNGGTIESHCAGWAVNRRVLAMATAAPHSWIATKVNDYPGSEAKVLLEGLAVEDPECERMATELCETLAWGFSLVCALMSPACFVIGGGLSHLGEPLRQRVHSALDAQLMDALRPTPPVYLAQLGDDVVPVGALTMAEAIAPQEAV